MKTERLLSIPADPVSTPLYHPNPPLFNQPIPLLLTQHTSLITHTLPSYTWNHGSHQGWAPFFSVRSVTFFSVLKRVCYVLFRSCLEFLATYETQKNVPFFSKERKRTQRMLRSLQKNGKERKERSILLQSTERTFRSFF